METDDVSPGPAGGAGARRRLRAAEFATWRGFIEVTAALRTMLGADLQATSALSPSDLQVLQALGEVPGRRLRSSDLAEAIEWDRSRLSHHLRRMEGRGLIQRDGCSTDHRVAYVSVTSCGSDAYRRAIPPHAKAIKKYFADALSPVQMEQLADIVGTLRRHLGLQPQERPAAGAPRAEAGPAEAGDTALGGSSLGDR